MLAQADNITRVKVHLCLQYLPIPHDQRAQTWLKSCGTAIA